MAISGGPDIVEDSLVCHIDMADKNCYTGSGATVQDLADSTTTGTISGASFSNVNGGAISFDSSAEKVELSKKAEDLNIHRATKDFSICVWFMDESNGSAFQTLFANESGFNARVGIYLHTNYRLYARVRNASSGGIVVVSSDNSYSPNTWNYGVMTHEKYPVLEVKAYLNGSYIGAASDPASFGSTAYYYYDLGNVLMKLGRAHHSYAYNPFTGKIACASIYNKVLTPDEVQQNYNATKGRYGL
jgi:hypothetical protein